MQDNGVLGRQGGISNYAEVRRENVKRTTGYFDLLMLDGTKVHASAKAKDCSLLERAKTLLIKKTGAPVGFEKPSIRALEVS